MEEDSRAFNFGKIFHSVKSSVHPFSPPSRLSLLPPSQPNTSTETLQSITSGDWDVTQVLAYDEENHLM